jgi:hypothetical protein
MSILDSIYSSKWSWLWNIDTFIFLMIFIAVIWCYVTGKHKKPKKKMRLDDYSDIFKNKSEWKLFKKEKKRELKKHRKLNKHEEKCREIFQSIFQRPFPSIRPPFLKNPTTGKNLELDGYCPDIETHLGTGIAFEYDGVQHAKNTGMFHKGKYDFEYQCAKDKWKDKRCEDMGIALVRIPHSIAYEDLEKYIVETLKKRRLYLSDVTLVHPRHPPTSSFGKGLYD